MSLGSIDGGAPLIAMVRRRHFAGKWRGELEVNSTQVVNRPSFVGRWGPRTWRIRALLASPAHSDSNGNPGMTRVPDLAPCWLVVLEEKAEERLLNQFPQVDASWSHPSSDELSLGGAAPRIIHGQRRPRHDFPGKKKNRERLEACAHRAIQEVSWRCRGGGSFGGLGRLRCRGSRRARMRPCCDCRTCRKTRSDDRLETIRRGWR